MRRIETEIPRLRRFARFLSRDADLADDLVQECLLRAISRIDTWQPGSNLRAWLLTILRNIFFTEMRRLQRTPIVSVAAEDVTSATTQESEPEFAPYLASIQEAFNQLEEEHREILVLVALEELTYQEAASILGIPVGTVRSRLSRARKAMRGKLGTRLFKLDEREA
jgi:RNA polymerase sigma-70 factor, ECF subfamily